MGGFFDCVSLYTRAAAGAKLSLCFTLAGLRQHFLDSDIKMRWKHTEYLLSDCPTKPSPQLRQHLHVSLDRHSWSIGFVAGLTEICAQEEKGRPIAASAQPMVHAMVASPGLCAA